MLKQLFWALFVLLGAALLAAGLHGLYHAAASRDWPVVEGVVLDAGLDVRRSHTFLPRVHYRYQVRGQSYESTRLYFSGLPVSSDRKGAEAMLAGLAPGRKVAVFHHPARPELAVLQPGITAAARLPLFGGLAFMGFGLLCLYLERRAWRRVRPAAEAGT